MDRRERFESLQEALRVAFDGERANLWTALPGIIQSFDPVTQTCTIQPAIKALLTSPAGVRSWVQLPLLVDCPVHFPEGGGYSLTFPVALGDEALVVFSSRSIDAWWASGNVDIQSPLRMHDLSDGMVFVGFSSKPKVISGISTNSVQLRSNAGTTFIDMLEGHITVKALQIDLTSWAGMIAPFAMGSVPAGWLACPTAQTLISTVTYARLFAAIGYTWGGAGASFGLPYFAAGYVPVAGTPGVLTHGVVKDHTHVYQEATNTAPQTGSSTAVLVSNSPANTSTPNAPEGGPDNLAAGMGVQLCVKY